MIYTFDEIEIATPGHAGGVCGRLDPITVEWDAEAAQWPSVLYDGITAIKTHSSVGDLVELVDIFATTTIESEFVCALVARAIADKQHDTMWLREMRAQWVSERRRTIRLLQA